jgi:hypothetical protein
MNKQFSSDFIIAYLTLFSGLSISAVAVYYSVIGLISIFSSTAIPIMIMGIVLEISKLVVTVWLKRHWNDASKMLLSYLTLAVIILMFITSMGIFGYLSKAHSDQTVPSGDIADKVALLDEKIKTQKDNIDIARKSLAQLDIAVDQTMIRSSSEQGAAKSVQIRKTQARERNQLQEDIAESQKEISKLREERAPIANDLRRVEAEVGPIRYIAAMVYGDDINSNILEKAVRWMIILIVSVFDPMAVMLLLACQHSFKELNKPKAARSPEMDEMINKIYESDGFTVEKAYEAFNIQEISPNDGNKVNTSGDVFPSDPLHGQNFTRTDFNPPKDFTFNGTHWVDSTKL